MGGYSILLKGFVFLVIIAQYVGMRMCPFYLSEFILYKKKMGPSCYCADSTPMAWNDISFIAVGIPWCPISF
jgi:hypothetical protein